MGRDILDRSIVKEETMLKGIPDILSPELLKVIAEMGHGDEIVIGDCNFPAASMGKRCIRADGLKCTDLLDAILQLFPLDTFVDQPVALMSPVAGTSEEMPPIWHEYKKIIEKYQPGTEIEEVERFDFYGRTKEAYATIATSEKAFYACIIIKKGVLL
jgi:L-fucose mutarotase